MVQPGYPTPLPGDAFAWRSALQVAYSKCLALQADADMSRVKRIQGCPPPLVCARVLGHLLRLAPAGNPQGQVQREIVLAEDHEQLMQLANHYLNTFIRAFKRSSGPTPTPSEHPSRPSFEDARDYVKATMEERTLDNRTARAAALRRDDYRCMITGRRAFGHGGGTPVQTAHIIPASVDKNIEEGKNRLNSAGVWAILSMFSQDKIVEDLAGNRINRLENIMSLNANLHYLFDELAVWLKPVKGVPDTYLVCTHMEITKTAESLPERVTFSTTEKDLPLPAPEFLALHALCCEVAWMSGAAEYVMDVEKRMDDTKFLAKDGSAVDVLMAALSFVQSVNVGS